MEKRKISLTKLYKEKLSEPSPAKQLIKEIAKLTERSQLTVRLWLSGKHKPEPLIQRIIAEHFNIDVEYLFPDDESSNVLPK